MYQKKIAPKKIVYQILLWFLLIAAILYLLSLAPVFVNTQNLTADDFGHFWATGKLTLAGQNPYDPQAILEILYQVGRLPGDSDVVSIMLNPPWTLPIVMLFGTISYPVSRMIWLLVNIILLMVSATKLWSIYHGPKKLQWIAWILSFTFTPVIATLQKGQFTPLILIGVTGFLLVSDQITEQSSRQIKKIQLILIAGFWISLMAIKPQLIYLIWLALFLWCLQQQKWLILIVGAMVLAIEVAIPSVFNPSIIWQYLQNMVAYPISEWATPTIGSYLRLLFGLNKFWLQFLPALMASIWFTYYWYHHRKSWSWTHETPLLVMISLVTVPYGWTYDLVLILPVIIFVAAGIVTQSHPLKGNKTFIIIVILYFVLDFLNIILHTKLNDFWFGWLTPGLLFIFWLYKRKISSYR
jgi:hypothetical protein